MRAIGREDFLSFFWTCSAQLVGFVLERGGDRETREREGKRKWGWTATHTHTHILWSLLFNTSRSCHVTRVRGRPQLTAQWVCVLHLLLSLLYGDGLLRDALANPHKVNARA